MTPDQFLGFVLWLNSTDYDPKKAHEEIDETMFEILEAHGYGPAVEVIRTMIRWHA